jgi:predicted nucleic acid-binding Zn ribbon protein
MPVYVYRNLRTGETFEVEQRITDTAWTEHPESGDPVKRLVQPVGIAFKGTGFYVNDARASSNGAPKDAKAGGDAAQGGAKAGGDGAASKAGSGAASGAADGAASSGSSGGGSASSGGGSTSKD